MQFTPKFPPTAQRPTYISAHAIERYRTRIDPKVDDAEIIRRIRAIVEPHRGAGPGVYSISSERPNNGPPVAVKLIVNETFGVTTVYPVTKKQIERATKAGNWVPKEAKQ